uniref:Uncharacterized protein n=1 Tax=Anguilla anguilla TaxID=7936 RepID=A0A0E9WGI9_ANGAN
MKLSLLQLKMQLMQLCKNMKIGF